MAQLRLSSLLLQRTHSRVVEASGTTLREVIADVDRKYHGFGNDLAPDGCIRRSFTVVIDGNYVDNLDAAVGEKAVIDILEQRVGG